MIENFFFGFSFRLRNIKFFFSEYVCGVFDARFLIGFFVVFFVDVGDSDKFFVGDRTVVRLCVRFSFGRLAVGFRRRGCF